MKKLFIFLAPILLSFPCASAENVISVAPGNIVQGDPVLVSIHTSSTVQKILFDATPLPVITMDGIPSALIPIDIHEKTGSHIITVTLYDGTSLTHTLIVSARAKDTQQFTIPDQFGGTTPVGEKNVTSLLSRENALLSKLWSNQKQLWTRDFIFPVENPIVTDTYGYTRNTGGTNILHKGTDFKASIGTPVKAMNKGVVRYTHNSPIYGKEIVIDHGKGLSTLYMHLSKINVHQGELVQEGHTIGLSGDTGYAVGPHLHVTVRINNISIDPETFMQFFKRK